MNTAKGQVTALFKRFQLAPGKRLVPRTKAGGCEGTQVPFILRVTYGLLLVLEHGRSHVGLHRECCSHSAMHLCALLHFARFALGL